MRKGSPRERALVWAIGLLVYAGVYLYGDSRIPLSSNNIPLQWVPVIVGGVCAVVAMGVTVEIMLRRK